MNGCCTIATRITTNIVKALALATVAIGIAAPVLAADPTPSWNGYRWARTGNLAIKTVSQLSPEWQPYFQTAVRDWSQTQIVRLVPIDSHRSSAGTQCPPSHGTIQVCNGNYGPTGWLGYANVWTRDGRIVQATVSLNDHYFASTNYDTAGWRAATICQEIGHALGLDHSNTDKQNENAGTCMDYSDQPAGGGAFGPANVRPGTMDFAGLQIIYSKLDSSQIEATKPLIVADVDPGINAIAQLAHLNVTTSLITEQATTASIIKK